MPTLLRLFSPFPVHHSSFPFPFLILCSYSSFPIPCSPFLFTHSQFPFVIPRSYCPVLVPDCLFPIPFSLFPITCSSFPFPFPHSLFPIPCSAFPVPHSSFPFLVNHSWFDFPIPCSSFPVPHSSLPIPSSSSSFPVTIAHYHSSFPILPFRSYSHSLFSVPTPCSHPRCSFPFLVPMKKPDIIYRVFFGQIELNPTYCKDLEEMRKTECNKWRHTSLLPFYCINWHRLA